MAPVLDQQKDIILFDGVCNFCNSYINYVIAHDKQNKFNFAPLESHTALKMSKLHHVDFKKMNSIIIIRQHSFLTQSDAVIYILKHLGTWQAWLANMGYLIPPLIRNKLYKAFANNRYALFGKSNSCMIPSEEIKNKFLK